MAGLAGALNSVLIGGAGCILGVGATVLAYPQLAAYRADVAIGRMQREQQEWAASAEAGEPATEPAN